jgi:tetratricopeptide (TPR) repeat protein
MSATVYWQPDKTASSCTLCSSNFTFFHHRHHCRSCGKIFCDKCSKHKMIIAGVNRNDACFFQQQSVAPMAHKTESDDEKDTPIAPITYKIDSEEEKVVPFPKIGVRLSVFRKFINDNGNIERFNGMTTTQVNDLILKVVTYERQCSYCELLQHQKYDGVGKASLFVSHAWKFKFLDVVSALENHFKETPDVYIWFDMFSNNQHLAGDLPFEWWTNTFKSAIHDFGRTVMVLAPWNDPIPFTRALCLFEIYSTVVTGSKFEVAMIESEKESFIHTIMSEYEVFHQMLADIDVNKSEAWNPDDRARIFEVVQREVGLDELNLIVKGKMREWAKETLKNAVQKNTTGADHSFSEDELLKMMAYGTNLLQSGQSHASLDIFQKCLSGFLSLPGWFADDARLGFVYERIGSVLIDLGEYDFSLMIYRKGLDIELAKEDSNSIIVGDYYNYIGNVYKNQKKDDLALEYYNKSLAICLIHGANNPIVGMLYNNIAIIYKSQQKYDLALEYFNQSVAIALLKGATHPTVGSTYLNIGALYEQQLKYGEALEYFAKALPILLTLGPNHPHVQATMQYIARGKKALGEN